MYSKRKMCCLIATCSLLVCMFRAEIFAKGNEQQEFFISVSEIPVGAENTYSSRRQISFKKESQIKKTAIPEPEWKRRRAS